MLVESRIFTVVHFHLDVHTSLVQAKPGVLILDSKKIRWKFTVQLAHLQQAQNF